MNAQGLGASAIVLAMASTFAMPASAETITPIGDIQRGASVTVTGTVDRILDEDEFRLADETGRVRVYIGPNQVPAQIGDEVTVRGIVDDDITLEIYARQMVLPDGTTVTFDLRYQ